MTATPVVRIEEFSGNASSPADAALRVEADPVLVTTAHEVIRTLDAQHLVPGSKDVQRLMERTAEVPSDHHEPADDLLGEDLVVGNVDCGTIGHGRDRSRPAPYPQQSLPPCPCVPLPCQNDRAVAVSQEQRWGQYAFRDHGTAQAG